MARKEPKPPANPTNPAVPVPQSTPSTKHQIVESHGEVSHPSAVADSGNDWYWEDGYMVFTEAYHLKRGKCCKSGCRHCPYGFVP